MKVSGIFSAGYDDCDHGHYKKRYRGHYKKYRHYYNGYSHKRYYKKHDDDDDDNGLLGISIDL